MASRRRRRAVRLGIPALVIGVLSFVALWRVGVVPTTLEPGAAPSRRPAPLPPLTSPPDVLVPESIGRQALLERVAISTIPSARTLWVGANGIRLFIVLDPDVKRSHEARVVEGGRVTLVGLVRRAPSADVAMRQWRVDAETARTVETAGIYLHVTEVRAAG
jgi:hypothetical protein